MNIQTITDFFANQDYGDIRLGDRGRHLVGQLNRAGCNYFLKLEKQHSAPGRPSVRSEVMFNLKVAKAMQLTGFEFPQPSKHGRFQGSYYAIFPSFSGPPLCQKFSKAEPDILESWLPAVAQLCIQLSSLTYREINLNLAINDQLANQFVRKTLGWFEDLPASKQPDLSALMDIIEENKQALEFGFVSHGDLTPWHIIVEDKRLVVIDAEHGLLPNINSSRLSLVSWPRGSSAGSGMPEMTIPHFLSIARCSIGFGAR